MTRFLFIIASALFLCSLLVLFSAPTASLVVVAILIAEWGYYFALLAIGIAVITWRRGLLGRLSASLALIAALLCLSPTIRAIRIAKSLPARFDNAVGATPNDEKPFRFLSLFRSPSFPDVAMTTHVYADALKLDLYQSKDAGTPQPLIIMIHGGSWNRGSKEQLPAINSYLAHEHYAVAAINYRHAPKWQFPAQIDDVFRAIDFLKARADELHIDATRLALIGRSAGAQIALSAAYSGRDPAIRGVVAFYPPTDLVFGYDHPSARWVLDSGEVLREYLGGTPAEKRAQYIAASPINFVTASTPPTVLIHGGLDSAVGPVHSEMLDARLEQAHVPHFYLSLGWATHGCDANLNGPSGQLSRYVIDRFLRTVFR
ncbi:MAG: alpha/beta hydrolase [Verrucomicrobiota bacterium]|nr:alpha/beta hydrolase [Verrucomicrobiota bacterium]